MKTCWWLPGLLALFMAAPALAADEVEIVADVVYGRKDGMALTLDVLRPVEPNGAGVLFIQSGGWYSAWSRPQGQVLLNQPLLAKGFTVFIVRHGSAPKYNIPEIVADVRRSVRFVRGRAAEWGVDPDRLGVMGGSAGGHLSLVLATTGDDGDPNAADEVLRQPSRVAAAVALYPPTDLRTWVTDPPEPIRNIAALKPPLTFDPKLAPAVSPLANVSRATPPILLIHGDKDELVPIEHSRQLAAALEREQRAHRLLVIEGAGHAFNAVQGLQAATALLQWFEAHLATQAEP